MRGVLLLLVGGFASGVCAQEISDPSSGAAGEYVSVEQPTIEYRFNTAWVEFVGAGARSDIQQNGVSLRYEIVDVKNTPELGESRTIQGRDLLLYQETAIVDIFMAQLAESVTLGKGRKSAKFDASTPTEMLLIDQAPAICIFGEPDRRNPYAPEASCLVDVDDNQAFDAMRTRRAGKPNFSQAKDIDPVSYSRDTQRAELFFRDQNTPVPGFKASVQGWNGKAARVQISPIVPVESSSAGFGNLSVDDVKKNIRTRKGEHRP